MTIISPSSVSLFHHNLNVVIARRRRTGFLLGDFKWK